jgi:hypothetical protein
MLYALFEALIYTVVEGAVPGVIHVWPKRPAGNRNSVDVKNWRDDPVYKKNLQRLIDRSREFEEARK